MWRIDGVFAGAVLVWMAWLPQAMPGQWNGTNPVSTNSNVGIGTSNPGSLLHLAGLNQLNAPQGDLLLSRFWNSASSTRASAVFHYYDSTSGKDLLAVGVAGDWAWVGQNWITPNQISQAKMVIAANGSVGIGTINPPYRLSVDGMIGARDVIVTNTPWADYVFRPGYRLRPLSEVSAYIQKHRHLPDIPTEAEVKRQGVSVGEMQAKLLAKVEELTLHLIQGDERSGRLERENRELRERIVRLEQDAGGTRPAAGR